MPIKKYMCRALTHMSITVEIGGKSKRIEFTNGMRHPNHIPGSFSTSSPELQDALEAHPGYGFKFYLKETYPSIEEGRIEKLPLKEPETIPTDEPEKELVPAQLVAEEVYNAQQAKDWLVENLHVTYRQVMNKAMILLLAEEHNVTFPNWK